MGWESEPEIRQETRWKWGDGNGKVDCGDRNEIFHDCNYLMHEYSHEEVIDKECLRDQTKVVFEEKDGEYDSGVLSRCITERTTDHLHTANHYQSTAWPETYHSDKPLLKHSLG